MDTSSPPLEALARKSLANMLGNYSLAEYAEDLVQWARETKVDGGIFMANKGCCCYPQKTVELRKYYAKRAGDSHFASGGLSE